MTTRLVILKDALKGKDYVYVSSGKRITILSLYSVSLSK